MYKYAQILNNKVQYIFEHEQPLEVLTKSYFTPETVLVNITDENDIKEGYDYINGVIVKPSRVDNSPKLQMLKVERNKRINEVLWMVDRHKQQLELVEAGIMKQTTLSSEQYIDLLKYIQQLRDFINEITDLNVPMEFPINPLMQ